MLTFIEKLKIQKEISEKIALLKTNLSFIAKLATQKEVAALLSKLNAGMNLTEIDDNANEAATSPNNSIPDPSVEQLKAGNYKKGHVDFQGIDIAIENPKGSERNGVDGNGNDWSITMNNHYGYIKKTMGADGDEVDVFLGDNPESDKVFIVNQIDTESGKFDEHKVMLGFNSQQEAKSAYNSNYEKDWGGLGSLAEMSLDNFKEWIKTGDTKSALEIIFSSVDSAEETPLDANYNGNNAMFEKYLAGGFNTESAESFIQTMHKVNELGLPFDNVKSGVVSWFTANQDQIAA